MPLQVAVHILITRSFRQQTRQPTMIRLSFGARHDPPPSSQKPTSRRARSGLAGLALARGREWPLGPRARPSARGFPSSPRPPRRTRLHFALPSLPKEARCVLERLLVVFCYVTRSPEGVTIRSRQSILRRRTSEVAKS